MKTQQTVFFTPSGLEEIKKEYDKLFNKKRPVAVTRLSAARDLGDLSENSEYTAAREDLAFIDGRISELEEIIREAKVVAKIVKGQVDLGCKVTLHLDGKKEIFTIVGEWEANPLQKKISHVSPLGQALLGKKVGEKVEVSAPVGKLIYTIIEIE